MKIQVVTDRDRFAALQDEWTDVLRSSASLSPFLTWEWLYAWWTHLAGWRQLAIATVHDGEALVAIAPFAAAHAGLPLVSRLELLGTGQAGSDYMDVVAREGYEARAVAALAEFTRQKGWAIHAGHLPSQSNLQSLAATLASDGWTSRVAARGVCPYIRLTGHTWDSFLGTLGPSHRATTRRRLRALERQGAQFERITDERGREHALARLFEFHHARFGRKGTAFGTPELQRFHFDATRRLQQTGVLRLHAMRLEGVVAGVLYGMVYKDRFSFYQHGYDPRFQTSGIGRALLDLSIRAAIDEGLSEFDLLYGNESYKAAWTDEHRTLWQIDLYPPNLRGRLHERTAHTERALRALARRVLPSHAPQAG